MNILRYANQGATRNAPVTPYLENMLTQAVKEVYGPGYYASIYSGGQPTKAEVAANPALKRVGSDRHDHDKEGRGQAADVHIFGPGGKQIMGDALAPLGQYWAAKKIGGVGLEMHNGGIHLDQWTTPPPGGSMHWNYADKGGTYTPAMKAAMEAGLRGVMPNLAGIQTTDNPSSRVAQAHAVGAMPAPVTPAEGFAKAEAPATPASVPEGVLAALNKPEMAQVMGAISASPQPLQVAPMPQTPVNPAALADFLKSMRKRFA